MTFNLDKREISDVLEGNFKMEHKTSSRTVRIYISSEFTDAMHERSLITKDVFPLLRSHCKSLGLQFYGADLYSSIPSSMGHLPHEESREPNKDVASLQEDKILLCQLERRGTFKLALDEIKLCQSLSAGPNFVTLLAQKYGSKPLLTSILQEDFELLHAAIEEPSARNLLQQWYLLDTNAQPPEYILQAWNPTSIEMSQWIRIHDSLSKTVRKAARVALGKDVSKVQHFVMSAIEEEITCGIFSLKQNPNQCCFWFKRVFTDLLDQKPSDSSLETYADMTLGKRGMEFDTENLKILNILKEARLPAKYIGLDSTNIFEYIMKWHKGSGLDPIENSTHMEYLQDFSQELLTALKSKIDTVAETLQSEARNTTFQEVMHHSDYCLKKAKIFMDRPDITDKIYSYISSSSSVPLVVHGETGCGKTQIMAGTAHKMREKFPLQKMILVTRFIGISPQSFSIRNTLRSICEQLSTVLEEDPHLIPGDFPSITCHFKALLSLATSEKPIYILLDGVDQLSPEDGASGMSWLPINIPPHVKIVLSTSNGIKYRCYPVLQSLLGKHLDNMIEVPLLTKEECKALLAHQLSLRGRTLTSDQQVATMMILQRCPLPLYLDLVVVEVQKWRSYFGSKPWENAAPPTTLKDMTEKILSNLETHFGKTFFNFLACCISASKYGLTEMELLDILSCNEQVMEEINKSWKVRGMATANDDVKADNAQLTSVPAMLWSEVHQQLLPLTELKMGSGGCHVIRWSHRYFEELVRSRYFTSEDQTRVVYGTLADYFSGKSVPPQIQGSRDEKSTSDEFIGDKSPQPLFLNVEKKLYNVRKLSELPFCLARSGRRQELQDLLTDYHWLKGKICTSSCADVVEEFSAVLPVVPLQRSQSGNVSFYELRLLRDALVLSIKALNVDVAQLPAQLYGRLMPFINHGNTKRPILEQLVMSALEDSQAVLVPMQPLQYLPGGPLLLTMEGHRDAISALAATSLTMKQSGEVGLCIISSSWDKTLKSWDLNTTGVLKTFDGHTDRVLSVALTEDGQYTASGSADMTIRLWYVPTAKCLHVMRGHTAAVNAVAMTTDGSKTISGSSDGSTKVWNTDIASSSCGEIVYTMRNHRSPVLSIALFGNRILASGARNSVVLLADIVSGGVTHTYKGQDGAITAISMTTVDGVAHLLYGTQSGAIRVRLLDSGELTHLLRSSDSSCRINSIATSTNGKAIASYENGLLSVWDVKIGDCLYNLTGHQDSVLGMTLANEGNLVLTGCKDSSLHIWDLLSSPVSQDRLHKNSTTSVAVAVSPCGTYGVSGGDGAKLQLHDLEKGSVVGEIETECGGVRQVLVLRDSESILVAGSDGSIQLWSGANCKLLTTFQRVGTAVNCIAASPDSALLMSGNENAEVDFWNLKTGTKLKTFHNHSAAVVGVAFSQDRMLSASRDGLVCVRDFQTAKIMVATTTHADVLLCLAVSPNSAFFISGYQDKTCHMVDMQTGTLINSIRGHKGPVTCAKVLSNCMQCLSGSDDGYIRVWDVESGECTAMLYTDAPVTSCDVSWRRDYILYGTKGGWVSTAVYRATEDSILRKQQEIKFGSDLEFTESESTISAMGMTRDEAEDATSEDIASQEIPASDDGETLTNQLPSESSHEDTEESITDINVVTAATATSDAGPLKAPLNGFLVPNGDNLKHEVKVQDEVLPPRKEGVMITEFDGGRKTSSACLIL